MEVIAAAWSGPRRAYEHGSTIHEAVRRTARRDPAALALVDGDRRLSYAELDRGSDELAASLAEAGAAPGTIVAVLLERSAELAAVLLAVLKSGAAYAALDPRWPKAYLDDLIARLGAPLAVADGRPRLPCPVVDVRAPRAHGRIDVAGTLDSACCVFLTSGSTGVPKAVLSPHRATLRLFTTPALTALGERTVTLQAAPPAWDAFAFELWGPLVLGGTSVIVRDDVLLPWKLRELVHEHGVNQAWVTASLFNLLVEEDVGAFGGLEHVLTGGERVSPEHARRFLLAHPGAALTNGYGPVESCVFATTHPISLGDCDLVDGIPIGRPVANTDVYVVTPEGERCEVGEKGEIVIAGDGLALGYVGDDAATGERFVDLDLFGGPTRCYRTGDVGAWSPGGRLEFHGRLDRQVKIRGRRVELDHVERAVGALAGVEQAAVVAVPGATPGTTSSLQAFFTTDRGVALSAGDVRRELEQRLPAFLVPDELVRLDTMPLGSTGKIDRGALGTLAQNTSAAAPDGVGTAPDEATALVQQVAGEVLGIAAPPVDVPLFELGATSLSAARIASRVRERTGAVVPLAHVMSGATVAELAAYVRGAATEPDASAGNAGEDGHVPLAEAQVTFFVQHMLNPDDRGPLCFLLWRLRGDLDRAALAEAVRDVHSRHQALRARYVLVGGVPSAELSASAAEPDFRLIDAADAGAAEDALMRFLDRPLDIGAAEVWRVGFAAPRDAPRDGLLGIAVHHVAFDGWSEAVLADDLSRAYSARAGGRAPIFDRPAPSLAALQRERERGARGPEIAALRSFWTTELAGLEPLEWPANPDAASGAATPGSLRVALARELVNGVGDAARRFGATPFAVWLTAFADAVAAVSGAEDFGVGVPVARRDSRLAEGAVACLLNTVCLRIRRPSAAAPLRRLEETARTIRRALAAQDVPFVDVVRSVRPARRALDPLYQVMFVVQDTPAPQLELAGVEARLERVDVTAPLADFLCEIRVAGDGSAELRLTFRRSRVREELAHEVARRFVSAALELTVASR